MISRKKGRVRVLWNGKEEVVGLRERKGIYEFILRSGRIVKSDNRHLYEVVRRRINGR